MIRNQAGQKIGAQMVSATDGSAFTGAVTVSVTGDAGTQATGATGAGACTHEGGGYHTYAPTVGETDYALVAFTFAGTGAVPVTLQVYPSYPQTGDAYAGMLTAATVWAYASRTLTTVGEVTFVSPVYPNGETVEIIQGDDYKFVDDRQLPWSSTDWPVLTGATVVLKVNIYGTVTSYAMTVASATAVYAELTSAQTLLMALGEHEFELQATLVTTGYIVTLVQGAFRVKKDLR